MFPTIFLSMIFACGGNKPQPVNTAQLAEKSRKGYPDWVSNPYTKGFDPGNSVCASAQSNMGLSSGNVDAARSDAEIKSRTVLRNKSRPRLVCCKSVQIKFSEM